jgi:isoleucyl-tRNA synthetase
MLLYNSYVFLETYNNKNHKSDGKENILDKWVRARLNDTIVKVTDHIENYQVVDAAKEIESFIDDLSRWYIRRSRKRPEALPILQETILILNKLIAPFVPFFAEALHQSFRKKAKGVDLKLSIHLEDWPKPNKKLINKKLIDTMEEVRHLASLALAKRASASIKVRQPLASLMVRDLQVKDKELLSILADEINVKAIKKDNKLEEDVVLDTKITPALEKEGWVRDLVRSVQGLRQDAGLRPHDKINIFLSVPAPLQLAVESDKQFAVDINATDVYFKKSEKAEAGLSTKIGNQEIWLGLKKS